MHGTTFQITGNRGVDNGCLLNSNILSQGEKGQRTSKSGSDRKQYFQNLLAAKFNHQDLGKIAKAWGRKAADARQDFIHIQKLYDGMVMYMERYVEMKIP